VIQEGQRGKGLGIRVLSELKKLGIEQHVRNCRETISSNSEGAKKTKVGGFERECGRLIRQVV